MKAVPMVVAAALVLGMAGLAEAQHLDWAKDWDEAVAEATARNVPMFVVFSKDN